MQHAVRIPVSLCYVGDLYDIKEVITTGLPTAEGLAVDWIGDHIYWVDSGLDIIEVADLDGKNRSTIISHSEEDPMENPRSIAVDPRVGYAFVPSPRSSLPCRQQLFNI